MPNQNWLDDVLDEVEHVETPRSWLWWSLCCSISAACGNNYELSMLKGALMVKPNLYTILLGESGLGKEFPINLARELVERAGVTRVIAGRSSIQAIVKELATTRTRPDKELILDSRGFVVNGELSTAIIADPDALTILTDLYDNKSSWTNLLKGDGAEKLKNPYITALFGSSPAHFYDSIPQVNIEGGFIGRNFIVFEEKRYKDTDLLGHDEEPSLAGFPYDKYVSHLQYISSKSGRIIPDADSIELYNLWRRKWRENQQADKTGFTNRVPVHAIKVAMCLCVADKDSKLVINQGHMEEGIERVLTLVYSNTRATEGRGIDPFAAQTKMVLDYLLAAPENVLRRKTLLTKGYGSFDAVLLDRILDGLLEIGWISRERFVAGKASDWIITLAGKPLEQYRKFVEDRK